MKKQTAPETIARMNELLRKEDLTVPEAAEVLRVSTPTVYRLLEENALDSWRKTAGKGIRIYTSRVKRYIVEVQGRDLPNGNPKK